MVDAPERVCMHMVCMHRPLQCQNCHIQMPRGRAHVHPCLGAYLVPSSAHETTESVLSSSNRSNLQLESGKLNSRAPAQGCAGPGVSAGCCTHVFVRNGGIWLLVPAPSLDAGAAPDGRREPLPPVTIAGCGVRCCNQATVVIAWYDGQKALAECAWDLRQKHWPR